MHRTPFAAIISTPIGKLGIKPVGNAISGISWLSNNYDSIEPDSDFVQQVCVKIKDYFYSGVQLSSVPLNYFGSEFQIKVWKALIEIPAGTKVSYGDLSKKLNTSSRAIGQACRTNRIVLFVPCHRVVSVNGLGGYMGKANQVNIKEWLLRHEGAI